MTPGVLSKRWPDETLTAQVGPDGWLCNNPAWQDHLNRAYPVGGSTVGYPWVRAFWDALQGLAAEVITEPVPDHQSPDTIH